MKQDKLLNSKTTTVTLGQQMPNSWTPVGPIKDRASRHNLLKWKFMAGAIIESEARPVGVQLKRAAK